MCIAQIIRSWGIKLKHKMPDGGGNMIFVKTKDLRVGMRLAKPIYNKKGVMLYERNTKLTEKGISSVKNFELIGLYILEPAEPVPPMTEEDVEFERFQTMSVFNLRDDMQSLIKKKEPRGIKKLINSIIKNYGNLYHRVNFMQNLRSTTDYVYKHSLNVAILSAIISNVMNIHGEEQEEIVYASLIYDIGKLALEDERLTGKENPNEEEKAKILEAIKYGNSLLEYSYKMPIGVKRLVGQVQREIYMKEKNEGEQRLFLGTEIILVADIYDRLTSMKLDEAPSSEIWAIKYLQQNSDIYKEEIVKSLIAGINIAVPGTCVEFVNGEKGLVIRANPVDILRPRTLDFRHNVIHDLDILDEDDGYQIKDIMKTMDNRTIMNRELLKKYKSYM